MAKPTPQQRKQPVRRSGGARASRGGTATLLLGGLLGAAAVVVSAAGYLYFGRIPVAVTDRAAWWEQPLRSLPLRSRLGNAPQPPFPASEDAFEAGARVYRAQCASCHGTPAHESALGRAMAPHAQQFFTIRERGNLARQSPGELFWKTSFGLRRSGMPAFHHTLSDTEIWQTSLLLHGAGDDLPDPVRNLLAAPAKP